MVINLIQKLGLILPALKRLWKGWFLDKLIYGPYELSSSPENIISREYRGRSFDRLDVIVRYLAIEEYFDKNDYGFNLYNKMQSERVKNKSPHYKISLSESYESKFRNLIKSISINGYGSKSTIFITSNGFLADGSHRLALALYFDVPTISLIPAYLTKRPNPYSVKWFEQNGFLKDEISLIEEKKKDIFWKKGIFFPIILWPSVSNYFNKIEEDISYEKISSKDYEYDDKEFEKLVREIYHIDDIEEWKIDIKLTKMKPYKKILRVIWVDFTDPKYRKKYINNAEISKVGEQLKIQLRKKYKGKVKNYTYDIICHSGDNFKHNLEIMKILENK